MATGATTALDTVIATVAPVVVDSVLLPTLTPDATLPVTCTTLVAELATLATPVKSTTAVVASTQSHAPDTDTSVVWNTLPVHADAILPSVVSSAVMATLLGYHTRNSTTRLKPLYVIVTPKLPMPAVSVPVSCASQELVTFSTAEFALLQLALAARSDTVLVSEQEDEPAVWHDDTSFFVIADVTATPFNTAVFNSSCSLVVSTYASKPATKRCSTFNVPKAPKPFTDNTKPATSSTFLLFEIDTMSSMANASVLVNVVVDSELDTENVNTATTMDSPVKAAVLLE